MAVTTGTALLAGTIAGGGSALLDARNQKKAIKSMEDQKARSQAFIEKNMKQARGDIFRLHDANQDTLWNGMNAGLDLYQQNLPALGNTFSDANFNAQQQISRGLPQIGNAILGNPINYGAFQPTRVSSPGLTIPELQRPQSTSDLGLSQ